MVLFNNIVVGQRVEVKYEGKICKGTVRYKGGVGNQPGEWVGVELDSPVGNHNGLYHGRRYFQCPDKHGIFADAINIRFMMLKRCVFNRYKSVERDASRHCEEKLFTNTCIPGSSECENPAFYKKQKAGGFLNTRERQRPKTADFRLSHSVSNTMAPATRFQPQSARLPYKWDADLSRSSSFRQDGEDDVWISTPTVPKTHMPHSVQSYLTRKGWGDHKLIRESTVATFRDNFRRKYSNSISF
ncbi:uncharacterized protein LOC135494801 [Lineus longissimus]|uniref:uncharacterized protein LOC135494801 n=1 Tax=Lineus longissimus TaxID=88925 RepID=UPI002B4C43A2